jgi:hypothetical protein
MISLRASFMVALPLPVTSIFRFWTRWLRRVAVVALFLLRRGRLGGVWGERARGINFILPLNPLVFKLLLALFFVCCKA